MTLSAEPSYAQGHRRWGLVATGHSQALMLIACFAVISIIALSSNGIFIDSYLQDLRFPTVALYGAHPYDALTGPLGPVYYWPYFPFAADGHFALKDMLKTNLMVGWISGIAAFFLLRGLVGRWTLLALSLLVFAAAASPREIGALTTISFLAPYNRWGWAVLTPLALFALTPRNDAVKETWWRIALVGVALFLLFYMKVTYCAAGCLLLGAGVLIGTIRFRAAFVAGVVALICAALFEIYADVTIPYLEGVARSLHADVEIESRVAERLWRRNMLIVEGARYGAAYTILLCLLNPVLGRSAKAWGAWLRENVRALAAGAITIGAALLVMLQNHPQHESPLLSASLFLALAWKGQIADPPPSGVRRNMRRIAMVAVAVFGLSTVVLDLASIVRHSYVTHVGTATVAAFAGTPWQDVHITPPAGSSKPIKTPELIAAADALPPTSAGMMVYHEAARVAEGLAFLRQNARRSDVVFSYYHANEFPALLAMPEPAENLQWWDYGRTYSPDTFIAPRALLGDATWFLEPKLIRHYEENALGVSVVKSWELYHGYVEANFETVGESKYWRYWRRKAPVSGRP